MIDTDRTPYTYLIGWSKLEKYYYGVRFAKNCKPEDLWKTYFTSSKHVKQFRKDNGDPDIIEIRKIFSNRDLARTWESKLLIKIDVINNDKFLNKTNNFSISAESSIAGGKTLKSFEHREKIKLANIGKKLSNETKQKISKANSGKTGKDSPFYDKKHSVDTINKIKQTFALRRTNINYINI